TRRGREHPDDIILIGAHYDSVIGSPGANDNATGIAALLELSRLAAATDLGKTVRFVAFVNEEPPQFQTALMGSRVYARQARARGDRIRAMLSLETLGYYSEAPGSQAFPFPSALYRLFYPDRGNFILFVSNFGSRPLLRQAVDSFRAQSDFPVEAIATFEWVPGGDWSDHGSFWAQGCPARMVTDTALCLSLRLVRSPTCPPGRRPASAPWRAGSRVPSTPETPSELPGPARPSSPP